MLQYLAVRDFALIDRMEVDLGRGLNLLTGETGSGKSILIDAVSQLIGVRASLDLVRTGSEAAVIEGLFQLEAGHPAFDLLHRHEIPFDEDQIVIRRRISPTGSKIFVNGNLCTQRFLARLGRTLADIHGQHDQQDLLQPRAQLDFLDVFAGHAALRSRVAADYDRLAEIRERITGLGGSEQDRTREIDDLAYQLKELESLELRPDLEEELEEELTLLSTARRRAENAAAAYGALQETEPAVLSLLSRVERAVLELAEQDPSQQALAERVTDARLQLADAAEALRDYGQAIQLDPERLDRMESRLSRLRRALRRHGCSLEELISIRGRLADRLQDLHDYESRKRELDKQELLLSQTFEQSARELSERRRTAARNLAARVEAELGELAMQACRFEAGVQEAPPGPRGVDAVQFRLSANPGEPPRPLSKIASGGELSRIVLALKSIANVDEHARTLIFDEIDAGIGGETASAVGLKLKAVALQHQVLCVTHLPQIAAGGDQHFQVEKFTAGDRTEVRLISLDDPARRKRELARMLAGDQVSETTLAQAGELLERSRTTSDPAIS